MPQAHAPKQGHDMGSKLSLITAVSLGNSDTLRTSDAVIEFVISGVLIWFLFFARRQQACLPGKAQPGSYHPTLTSEL